MRHETSPDRITVLEVGAEGGGVTLHAERTERLQWRFCVDKHESLFEELLDEAAGSFHRESEWTTSWEHVLSLLNAYPWTRLRPTEVHPIFADAVASAYEARTGDSLSQNREWLEVLERAGWRAPERRECIAYSRRMDRALVLASVAHSSADRKGTSIPYVSHPVHVARLLERHGFDENVVIAGLLHDVVEDLDAEDEAVRARFRSVFPELSAASDEPVTFTQAVRALIEREFGPGVARLVGSVTERKQADGQFRPWLDRKVEQLRHLADAGPLTAALKCADALHNAASILHEMQEGSVETARQVIGRFNAAPDATLWHYGTVAALAGERLGRGGAALGAELAATIESLAEQVDRACGLRDSFTGQRENPVGQLRGPVVVETESGRRLHSVEQWRRFAPPAKGDAHWKDGRSAKELASAWFRNVQPALPAEVASVLATCSALNGLMVATAYPERHTALDNRGRGRQHDLLLHGLAGGRRIVIAVEGKADEPLGSTIEQELKKSGRTRTTGSSSGIPDRIRELSNKMFGRAPNGDLFGLRYQLLHGIAGMVIEADKSKAEVGVFLIHVFETDSCDERRLRRNDEDLRAFMNALGCPDPATGQLAEFNVPNGGGKYFIGKAVTTQSTITRSHAERGEANADALSRIGGTS
jgi:hypothetical protein